MYIFSGSKVIAEYVNGAAPSSPTREYVYSGAALIAKIESGATQYYQQDHLSARMLTDSSGNKIGEQGHFPYGESWYAQSTTTKWQFTTYERDAESGNDYAMAREYVNRLGRFSSPDPLAGSVNDPQSLNRYPYTQNNPINFVDPTGMIEDESCREDGSCGGYDAGGGGGIIVEVWACISCGGVSPSTNPPTDAPGYPPGAVPPPPDVPQFNGPSGGGGGGGPYTTPGAAAARAAVNSILSSDNQCSKWLNAATAASTGGEYLSAGFLFGQVDVRNYTDASGTVGAVTVQGSGDQGPIFLNSIGPFYAAFSASSGTKEMKVGPFTGRSLQAQATILLHELAHKVAAIGPDAKDPTASANNTQTVLNNCEHQIDGLQ